MRLIGLQDDHARIRRRIAGRHQRQKDPAGADRGSEQSQRRKPSSTLFRWCSFSAIVLPGMSSTPPR